MRSTTQRRDRAANAFWPAGLATICSWQPGGAASAVLFTSGLAVHCQHQAERIHQQVTLTARYAFARVKAPAAPFLSAVRTVCLSTMLAVGWEALPACWRSSGCRTSCTCSRVPLPRQRRKLAHTTFPRRQVRKYVAPRAAIAALLEDGVPDCTRWSAPRPTTAPLRALGSTACTWTHCASLKSVLYLARSRLGTTKRRGLCIHPLRAFRAL